MQYVYTQCDILGFGMQLHAHLISEQWACYPLQYKRGKIHVTII